MIFAGCSLAAAAGHPQALEGVMFALHLFPPLHHDRGGDSRADSDKREEETQELQPGAGHPFHVNDSETQELGRQFPIDAELNTV